MQSFRFVHTADWHLGQPYAAVPRRAEALRAARLTAVERTLDAALRGGAQAVLACGDLFDCETPDQAWVEAMISLVAERPALPVFVIPGNHDPMRPGSVYTGGAFARRPANLRLLDRPEPLPLPDLGVTLYPCPCTARWGDDPLRWIPAPSEGDGLRVALAHGSLGGFDPDGGRSYPIADDAPARHGLDYVALGDWHRPIPDPAARPSERMYYPGAPECGGWDEPGAGHALWVELATGAAPRVTAIRVGLFEWWTREADLVDAADVERLLRELEADAGPMRLVRLRLTGRLEPEQHDRLMQGLDEVEGRYAHLERQLDGLACRVGDPGIVADPRARRVLAALGALANDPAASPPALPSGLPPLDPGIVARAWSLARRHLE